MKPATDPIERENNQSEYIDEELLKYINEMIDMINTDDELVNKNNMEILVEEIAQKITL